MGKIIKIQFMRLELILEFIRRILKMNLFP